MHRGYVKIWRKLQDNWIWKEPRRFSKAEAWIDIIMEVQYKPEPDEVLIGNTVLICNRGESLKSLDTWAQRWNWDKSATRRFFNLLKKSGNIDTQSERVTTRIKVINYDTYCPLRNADETQMKRKRNASETQATPDNKDNKVKKEKKDKLVMPDWLDLDVWNEYKKYRQNGKGKFTPYAQSLAIKKLEKLREEGNNPALVMQRTIECGWSGLFPLKENKNGGKPNKFQRSFGENATEATGGGARTPKYAHLDKDIDRE